MLADTLATLLFVSVDDIQFKFNYEGNRLVVQISGSDYMDSDLATYILTEWLRSGRGRVYDYTVVGVGTTAMETTLPLDTTSTTTSLSSIGANADPVLPTTTAGGNAWIWEAVAGVPRLAWIVVGVLLLFGLIVVSIACRRSDRRHESFELTDDGHMTKRVVIKRGNGKLGLSLCGPSADRNDPRAGVFVTKIKKESPAFGKIAPFSRVHGIDTVDTSNATKAVAMDALTRAGTTVTFVVSAQADAHGYNLFKNPATMEANMRLTAKGDVAAESGFGQRVFISKYEHKATPFAEGSMTRTHSLSSSSMLLGTNYEALRGWAMFTMMNPLFDEEEVLTRKVEVDTRNGRLGINIFGPSDDQRDQRTGIYIADVSHLFVECGAYCLCVPGVARRVPNRGVVRAWLTTTITQPSRIKKSFSQDNQPGLVRQIFSWHTNVRCCRLVRRALQGIYSNLGCGCITSTTWMWQRLQKLR